MVQSNMKCSIKQKRLKVRLQSLQKTISLEQLIFLGKLKLVPNLEAVAEKFLASFRKGSLGKFFLDSDYLDTS